MLLLLPDCPDKNMGRRIKTEERADIDRGMVGEWLFEHRAKARRTQEEVAAAADIDTTYVGKIELGQKLPSRKVITRLAPAVTPEGADAETALRILNEGLQARGFVPEESPIRPKQMPPLVIEFFENEPPELTDPILEIIKSYSRFRDMGALPETTGKD